MDKNRILEAKKELVAAADKLLNLLDNNETEKVPAKDNRPVTERIKTFADALNELGQNNPLVHEYYSLSLLRGRSCDLEAYARLRIIVAALNEGWEPKFTEGEYRYFPYYYLYTQDEYNRMDDEQKSKVLLWGGSAYYGSNCGVACSTSDNGWSYSNPALGARLAFKTDELAVYAGKQFAEEFVPFLIGKEIKK
jgi:hypothetical protein